MTLLCRRIESDESIRIESKLFLPNRNAQCSNLDTLRQCAYEPVLWRRLQPLQEYPWMLWDAARVQKVSEDRNET